LAQLFHLLGRENFSELAIHVFLEIVDLLLLVGRKV